MITRGESSSPADRRQHARYALNRRVSVHLARWSSLQVLGHDISQGGIRLSLPYQVQAGEQLTVGLTLPNDLQIALDAEVRSVSAGNQPGGCVAGLRWVDATADDVEMLNQVIADLQTIAA